MSSATETNPLVTTMTLPTDGSVVSDADILIHSHHRGQADEAASISMEPGAYGINGPAGHMPFSRLTVLAGALEVTQVRKTRKVGAGESVDLSDAPILLRTRVFTQVALQKTQGRKPAPPSPSDLILLISATVYRPGPMPNPHNPFIVKVTAGGQPGGPQPSRR